MIKLPPHIANPNPKIYLSDNYGVTDVETTNKEKGSPLNKNNALLLGVCKRQHDGMSRAIYWGDEFRSGKFLEAVEGGDFWVAHNAKFELQWFRRCGIDLTKQIVWDTMLVEYIIAGNRGWSLKLDYVAKRWGVGQKESIVSKMIESGVCPSEIPYKWLEKYCIIDVDITHKVFLKQREWILENNPRLLAVVYTACLFCVVLADIEFNGVHIDKDRVIEEYQKYYNQLYEIDLKLDEFSKGINWNSGDQKAAFIYDELKFKELTKRGEPIRTAKGKRKTDGDTLLALRATTKKQKDFINTLKERSKVQAALSKTLEFFYGVVTEIEDNTFKAVFNQAVTKTHRLSSSGKKIKFKAFPKEKSAQFQNFPRKFKRLFSPRYKGWKIGEGDAPQLEFRYASQVGQDIRAIEDITSGFDVHRFSASELNEIPQEKVTTPQRQKAKEDTFKPLYGGSSGTPAQQKYYAAFKERYPGIASTQRGWLDFVLNNKYLETIYGLRFYWPTTKITPSGYITNTSNIYNYPIQYGATGEIIPISIIYQWHRMKAAKMESFIVNTIHDSSHTEICPNEEELYEEIVVQSFTEDVYQYLYNVYGIKVIVPLGVEIKIGSFLGEGEGKLFTKPAPFKIGE